MRLLRLLASLAIGLAFLAGPLHAQSFEEAVINIGNIGVTVTNAGFLGKSNVRNNPTGPPSFEYPLDSGIEHLFESGLWIGAFRSDGIISVRSGAVTTSGGYSPGLTGYEFAQSRGFVERSTLLTSSMYSSLAVSHQDFLTAFEDTSAVLPGTAITMPDPAGKLGAFVEMQSYAWNFPFTEYFVILNFDIHNISDQAWDSVYVGMYHDSVVRNINTTTDAGGNFFNKGGYGFIDSLQTMYAFNAGGTEETINTYGSFSFLGAEWVDPASGLPRLFHPSLADEYIADGYSAPVVNPRWWLFGGGTDDTARPGTDEEKYRRLATPFPNPRAFASPEEFETARAAWYNRLRTDGLSSTGNWIGLTPIGPFPRVGPGDRLQVTFALVAAVKPEESQGQAGKSIDSDESRAILANNITWAKRTYFGEDNNRNGVMDPGEDVNGNGLLDRYVIPEPPSSPAMRVEFENSTDPTTGRQDTQVALYWDRSSEESRDPVSGLLDFEGYRLYRSRPGDDLSGNILGRATLLAQFDKPGNRTGFNNGFSAVEMASPVTFEGDSNEYWYRFVAKDLLNGWQYLFTITAFDTGDPDAGLESFESSRTANATRVFPGTPIAGESQTRMVGVYPNPYRVNAAWDGSTNRTRKLNFYNLPERAEIRVYTLAGEIVKDMLHEGASYVGDIRWYDTFSAANRRLSGGEHSWDILSENSLNIAGGLYFYTIKDLDNGEVQKGKFVIIK